MAELLAPAGSLTGLKAVITAGADAVYIGGSKFGARAYADNPNENDLLRGLDYAHLRGVRVYLTVNTLLKEKEMEELYSYVLPYYREGVDAILVQDFGVLRFLHSAFPDLPLHASTQMTLTGPLMPPLLKKMGVTRVVPAREMTFQELREIRKSGLEVETFIHGALCVCYSGQCLMSSMIGGRSGNRGRCAQPCRMLFLMDDRTGYNGRPVITDRKEARHFISPKDLNGIDMMPSLYAMGIDSFKIEGRMKRPEYAAGVVSVYRRYLDLLEEGKPYRVDAADRKALYDLYNRSGFTDGYFNRHNGPAMMAPVKHELTREETASRHALYEKMHRLCMEEEKRIPVTGTAFIYRGQPISLSLCAGTSAITVEGPVAEAARKQPLGEETIADSLKKTGGTDFEVTSVDVITDGESFLTKSSLNELRRQGLESLRQELLKKYVRSGERDVSPEKFVSGSEDKRGGDVFISALVSTREQMEAALHFPEPLVVYAESFLFQGENRIEDACSWIRRSIERGHAPWIALPYIVREGSREETLCSGARKLMDAGLEGFLIRSPESLAWAVKEGLTASVRADAGLYTYNSEAQAFLRDLGVVRDTAPIELNKKELGARENSCSEVIVYGRLPLMISAQCIEKTTNRCTGQYPFHILTDRMGMKFPVKSICDFCYTILYNSVPLSLLGETPSLLKMGFRSMRALFTLETGEEVTAVLHLLAANARHGGTEDLSVDHTKGHYLRGVE